MDRTEQVARALANIRGQGWAFEGYTRAVSEGLIPSNAAIGFMQEAEALLREVAHGPVTTVWQVIDITDYEVDKHVATFADEVSADRLAKRLRDVGISAEVRSFPLIVDPDAVEIIQYAGFVGPVTDTDEQVAPWITTLVEGRDDAAAIVEARRYTREIVTTESDEDESWQGLGTVRYISVDGPTIEQVREVWIAARDAYVARADSDARSTEPPPVDKP